MNLQTRARRATDEALATPLDVDRGLAALRRTRRHRAGQRVGVALAAVALVLAGAVLIHRHEDAAPQPVAPPLRGGAVLALTTDGTVTQVSGPPLPHLPAHALTTSPFRFTADGAGLVYAADGAVHRLDLRDGSDDTLDGCPDSACAIAYTDDGSRSAAIKGKDLVVTFLPSGSSTVMDGRGVSAISWSPGGDSLALVVQQGGQQYLYNVNVESGRSRRVMQGSRDQQLVGGPVWANGGDRVAVVVHLARAGESGQVELVAAKATGRRGLSHVHSLGRCVCADYVPGVAWSADDSQLAVTEPGAGTVTGGPVESGGRDGSHWRQLAAGAFRAVLAWQPEVTR